MKIKLGILLVFLWISSGVRCQVYMVNDSAQVIIDAGITGTIKGNLVNKNNGNIDDNGTLKISGDFTNTATFNQDNGLVLLNGSGSSQNINGDSSTFYYLELNNSSGAAVITGFYNIRHTLTLTSGTLTTNDSLILLSDNLLTARIAEIPSSGSNISGDITMQRYLDNGLTGWHIIGAATSGGTLTQWDDDIITTGFTGSNYPSFSFINIYTYDETVGGNKNIGYVGATNITNAINSGEGYWTYIGPVPLTLDTKGPAHTFTQSLPVTYTSNVNVTNDGWNLVANPYPSNINWTAINGWTKTNIDNAIYFYDPDNGVYASYVSGVSANGGTQYIASSQAIWVKANASSPVLSLDERVKTSVDTTFFRKKADLSQAPLIRLRVESLTGGVRDETVLCFSSLSSGGWDAQYDAYKLEDTYSPASYIATVLQDSIDISINSLPQVVNEGPIPLRVKVKKSGKYVIRVIRENFIDPDNCLYLEDLDNGSITDLKTDTFYSFYIKDSITAPRFIIHTNPKIDLEPHTVIVNGSSVVLDAGSGYSSYLWSNGSSTQKITVNDTGNYWVEVQNSLGCTVTGQTHVGLDSVTGVKNANPGEEISIILYPNPTNELIYIRTTGFESGNYTFRIYSASGVLVMEKEEFIKEPNQILEMNVNHLAAGSYYVVMTGSSGVFVNNLTKSQ